MTDNELIIYGEPPPPDYEKELKELETVVSYEKSISKLEDFGKWLFTSSSVIGVLGAGYSISGFSNLNWLGNILFCCSLLFVTICLAFSALALSPKLVNYNPNSVDSVRGVIEEDLIKAKGKILRFAGIIFSLAIFFAGLAPLSSQIVSSQKPQYFRISHEILNGKISVFVDAEDINGLKPVDLKALLYYKENIRNIYQSVLYPDLKGQLSLKVALQKDNNPFLFDSVYVKANWYSNNNVRQDTVYKILNLR